MSPRVDFHIVELLAAGFNARGTETADLAQEVLETRERYPQGGAPAGNPWRIGRRRSRHVYRADLADDHDDADVATFRHSADAEQAVADRAEVMQLRQQVADLKNQILALTPPIVITHLSEGHYPNPDVD